MACYYRILTNDNQCFKNLAQNYKALRRGIGELTLKIIFLRINNILC
jgi:hypothetical protein